MHIPSFLSDIMWSDIRRRVDFRGWNSFSFFSVSFPFPPPPALSCLFLFLSVAESPDKMLVVVGGNFTNIVSDLQLASYPDLGQVILTELRFSFFCGRAVELG